MTSAFILYPYCTMTISNFDLVKLAKLHNVQLLLTNIIMADEMQNIKLNRNMNLIINLQDSSKNGSHWVAFIVKGKNAFYFDSFGAQPDNYVTQYCRKNGLQLGYNNYIIQDLNSTQCEIFCIALLKYITTNKSIHLYEACDDFINIFNHNTKHNDKILQCFMKK